MLVHLALLLSVLPHLLGRSEDLRLEYRGQAETPLAAFSMFFEHSDYTDPNERYSCGVSAFSVNPLSRDDVFWFEHPGKYLNNVTDMEQRKLFEGINLPREPGQIPNEVFGHDALTLPSGFIFPGKENGTLALVDMRNREQPGYTDISTGATEAGVWFYHRVLWRDGDGDGDLDAFTCRARVRLGQVTSQFLWFANPGGDDAVNQSPWDDVTVVSEGDCDTMLAQTQLEVDGHMYEVTFTIGFFTDRLSVYWSEPGRWGDPEAVGSALIDLSASEDRPDDHWFDVEVVDLNNDGRLDLLTSINSPDNGTMIAYEIPDDFRNTDQYVKHVLASGFEDRIPDLDASGAPGQPISFYPRVDMTDGKPWILLSGDDEGTCYYFYPQSEEQDDWTYVPKKFMDLGADNIIGKPSVGDLDGDGLADIALPTWHEGALRFYSFTQDDDVDEV